MNVADMKVDMEVDLVVGKVANMKVDMVADMGVDKVATMEVDLVVGKVVNRVAHMVAVMDFLIIFWAGAFFGEIFCISQ